MNIETSKTLLDQLREPGNNPAWNQFYTLYSPLIFGFVRKRHFDRSTAEDILQETMCEVVRYLPRFEYNRQKGRFSNYLFKIVCRIISKRLKEKESRRIPMDSSACIEDMNIPDPHSLKIFDDFKLQEKRNLIRHALVRVKKRVEPLTWKSFDLYVLTGKSALDAATELGISDRSAVYKQKERVIAFLKEEVKKIQNEIGDLDEAASWEGKDYEDKNLKTSYFDVETPSTEVGKRIDLLRKIYLNHPPPGRCSPKFLVVTSGNSRWVDVTQKFYIGTHPTNSLQLNSDFVSKKHGVVVYNKGNWSIRDLQSKNGVLVNNQPISEKILNNGDIIKLGNIQLVFISTDPLSKVFSN